MDTTMNSVAVLSFCCSLESTVGSHWGWDRSGQLRARCPLSVHTSSVVITAGERDILTKPLGKPCRRNKIGSNAMKWSWGGRGRGFRCPYFDDQSELQPAGFLPSPFRIFCTGPSFFLSSDTQIIKLNCVQQGKSREKPRRWQGYVAAGWPRTVVSNLVWRPSDHALSPVGFTRNERRKFFLNAWVLDSGGSEEWGGREIQFKQTPL